MRLNPVLERLAPFSYCGTDCPTHLDANESCVPLADEIRDEITEALRSVDLNRYPDDRAVALRRAFAAAFSVDADCVTAGNGSDELIRMIVGGLVPPGGLVLGIERDFGSYWSNAQIFGRRAIQLPREADMTFTADALLSGARQNDADLVIFSNPNNPSGSVLPRADVIRLLESTDCLVVVDEAYMDFADQSVLDLAGQYENLIVLRTLSKAMGLAGARVGFAVSTGALTYAMRSVRDAYNVSAADQTIAEVLLRHPKHLERTLTEISRLMGRLQARLADIAERAKRPLTVYPSVTNFVLLRVESADEIDAAMRAEGISLRLLDSNHLRISVAPEATLNRVLDLLENIVC